MHFLIPQKPDVSRESFGVLPHEGLADFFPYRLQLT